MLMVFIETSSFSKQRECYLNDDEYADFQAYLKFNPNAGDVIPNSGGLRKIRWAGKGKGKRGGLRIIHYNQPSKDKIWLLDIYAKNQNEFLTIEELKVLRKEVPND